MHEKKILTSGKRMEDAEKVLVMVHGRGATAEDIISLAAHLNVEEFSLLAPQATTNAWYPYSFIAPSSRNEPWLTSALDLLKSIVAEIESKGIKTDNIYFLGFSQGACLVLEFLARNAKRYGGAIAFTGGLIGEEMAEDKYVGDFSAMPIFIGTSDPDSHVPLPRVHESVDILRNMSADVRLKVYPGMGHTINEEELVEARTVLGTG